MSIQAQVLRQGGFPANWAVWGSCNITPGETTVIGSGSGPMFTISGVEGGAQFQCGDLLNITLKVTGVSSQLFSFTSGHVPNQPTFVGQYKALVSS